METPVAPERGAFDPVYGVGGDSINRRALIGALAAGAVATPATAAPRDVSRLRSLGKAHLEVDGRSLDIAGETTLEMPLLRVRSTTFILAQGPATARTLILEPDGQWVERDGQRSPLPPQLGIHERQQYAIYAYLLLIQQRKRPRPGHLSLSEPPYPDAVFEIGADGYPTAVDWTVEDAEIGKPPIPERFVFSGRTDSNGVRWPRRLTLTQRGRPYFDLTIAEFSAT